jgi:hypothetical protein
MLSDEFDIFDDEWEDEMPLKTAAFEIAPVNPNFSK